MDFAGRIRAERKARHMSQEALARQAGMSLRALNGLERGEAVDPHYSTLARLADALNISVGDLLEEPGLPGKGQAPPSPEDLADQRRWMMALLSTTARENRRDAERGVSPAVAEFAAERSDDLFIMGERLYRESNPDFLDSAVVGLHDYEVALHELLASTVELIEAAKELASADECDSLGALAARIGQKVA